MATKARRQDRQLRPTDVELRGPGLTGGPCLNAVWFRVLALALAIVAAPAYAQQRDFAAVQFRVQRLGPTLWMLAGAGGNLALSAGEDSTFLVDDDYGPLTPKLEAEVAKLSSKPVRFVVNTHWHGDHTGGNENLGKAGAVIFAHDNVRKRMSTEQFIAFLNITEKPEPRAALPTVTFARDITFHQNGDEIHVFHVPAAHTDGDAVVHFRGSDVVHMGDVFFNGRFPFIDTSSGGTIEGVVAAADQVLAIAGDTTRIIPGHGPLASRRDLVAYRDMLAAVSARIRDGVRAGRTLQEVVAAKPTADFDGVWGKGFLSPDRFVEMVYRNVAR
jgi:glyoxylase-like metal-dependent hydrolase (beta-lactamase superfamily II)